MATLITRISDLAQRVANESKSIRTLVNGNAADLTSLTTTSKTNLVSALNELKSAIDAVAATAGSLIDDTATTSSTKTHSVTKIRELISTSISTLTSGAPAALDTLDELAAALGDDANFAATITAALGNRVRIDAAQTISTAQRNQVKTNLDVLGVAEIGNPDTNFVTVFNTGLL